MGLVELVLIIIVVGLIVWAVNTYIPISDIFKKLITIVCVIVVCLIFIKAIGLNEWDIKIPRLSEQTQLDGKHK